MNLAGQCKKTEDDQAPPALHHSSIKATSRRSEIGRTSISGSFSLVLSFGAAKERRENNTSFVEREKTNASSISWYHQGPAVLHHSSIKATSGPSEIGRTSIAGSFSLLLSFGAAKERRENAGRSRPTQKEKNGYARPTCKITGWPAANAGHSSSTSTASASRDRVPLPGPVSCRTGAIQPASSRKASLAGWSRMHSRPGTPVTKKCRPNRFVTLGCRR